ncbi:MAG: DNA cytosine methyltransferase [Candidatus Poseidoniaceae archaeon]
MWKMLDLFSGLGGASESMVMSENWEVMRVENNSMLSGVAHSHEICVKQFRDELRGMIDDGFVPESPTLIWASPPCVEFSFAYSSPQSKAIRAGEEYNPDMSLLEATIDIIEMLQPKYWVIENVRGAVKWFKPYLGEQKQVINHSIFLWGNYPSFDPGEIESKFKNEGSSRDPLRANKRALIPFSVSNELRRAIEQQRSILEWC